MSKLILHVDGSEVTTLLENKPKAKARVAGWGLIAHGTDIDEELSGAFTLKDGFKGYHECAAFVHGVLFAKSKGIEFKDVSLYTDDQEIGYSNMVVHPENWMRAKYEHLCERFQKFCEAYFTAEVAQECIRFCKEARITKLKGHAFYVYQERADYLARTAAWSKAGKPSPVSDFDSWLEGGIQYYASCTEPPRVRYAPFTAGFTAQRSGFSH